MVNKKNKVISESELRVLDVLWKSSPLSASQIIEALEGSESWSRKTIKSFITRLVAKNAIGYEESGNSYLYYPILKKHEYMQSATTSFINRVFGGKVSPLVAHFANNEMLTPEDVNELKAILAGLESDGE